MNNQCCGWFKWTVDYYCKHYGLMDNKSNLKWLVSSLPFFQEVTSILPYIVFLWFRRTLYPSFLMNQMEVSVILMLKTWDDHPANNHQKLPGIKSIWEFSGIYLKGWNGKGKDWYFVLRNKGFKGMNGTKEKRHYNRSVLGSTINTFIVTVPTEMRFQMNNLLTKNKLTRILC